MYPNATSQNDYRHQNGHTSESNCEMLSLNYRCFFLTVVTSRRPHVSSCTTHDSSLTSCMTGTIPPPTSIQGCTPTAPRGSISTGGRGGEFPFKVPDELTL